MAEKLIVQFQELPVLPYNMDYLTYCKHCGTYNLGSKACVKCGRQEEVSLEQAASGTTLRQFIIRQLLLVGLYSALFILADSFKSIALATMFTLICLVCNTVIYKQYQEFMVRHEIIRHIASNEDKIKSDLSKQMGIAIQDVESGNVVEAYDRFRYLAKLIDNDEVRTYKLLCLRNFQLRSDMPLELKGLLQQECNSYLIDYIYEVSKVRKELVDDATLDYIVKYKEQVLMKNKGKKIMGSVLAGALKSKFLFIKYAEEMPGYLSYFSKDRLLRLCKMSNSIKDVNLRSRLLTEVREIVGADEAFTSYLQI